MTPRGWLSTWSGLSSHARLADTMPHVKIPTLSCTRPPTPRSALRQALEIRDPSGSDDVTYHEMKGAPHYLRGVSREAMDRIRRTGCARDFRAEGERREGKNAVDRVDPDRGFGERRDLQCDHHRRLARQPRRRRDLHIGTGQCSLRAAVQEANASAGADTILIGPGSFALTRAGAGEDFPRPATSTCAGR